MNTDTNDYRYLLHWQFYLAWGKTLLFGQEYYVHCSVVEIAVEALRAIVRDYTPEAHVRLVYVVSNGKSVPLYAQLRCALAKVKAIW
ncbi:MAG: hypothetical protein ACJA13_004260 [Paraglaciecola sp.]|jgi:hypothetical protein